MSATDLATQEDSVIDYGQPIALGHPTEPGCAR